VPDGYQVEPATLRRASTQLYEGSDSVGDAAAVLSVAQLVPAALGEVPAAAELASAFAKFVGTHGDDLRHGSVWVNDAADGLVKSAEDYENRDQTAAADVTAAGS
jgi:Excreted virulence factor EspC, type VII ESX diderm